MLRMAEGANEALRTEADRLRAENERLLKEIRVFADMSVLDYTVGKLVPKYPHLSQWRTSDDRR